MRNVVAVVLGGGRGSRLFPLTSIRSKPAVPLAGKYRLIDIPISNCINSGIDKMYVLTQFMSVSLHAHIRRTYSFDQFNHGFVEILAAQETADQGSDWFQGTADAVRKNLGYIEQHGIDYVLILSGDQLYRMNYRNLIGTHIKSNADVTIACRPVDREAARGFGIMRLDDTGRVIGFFEKPQSDAEIDMVRMDPAWIDAHGVESNGRDCMASMGIYVFSRETLLEVLNKTDYWDFGKEVFPAAIRSRHVQMHLYDDYWEDIGTIRSFYEANLRLAGDNPPFSLTREQHPIFTRARFLPPTRFHGARISDSLIADGCRIGRNVTIENSVVGLRSIIGDNVTIKDSYVMGNDFYERDDDIERHGMIPVGIGDRSIVQGAIVDKNARIGKDVRIVNDQQIENSDSSNPLCVIRDSIPVVIKGVALPDGWALQREVAMA
ncbi:MAG: glucose-1-phosphate adenylyltransferase [Pirellulaceae bacterium]